MHLSLSVRAGIRETVVAVSGELDVGTVADLASLLARLIGTGSTRLAIDLSGVTFMDCTGLNALVRAHDAAVSRGGGLRLLAVPRRVRLLLTLTGRQALAGPRPTAHLASHPPFTSPLLQAPPRLPAVSPAPA